MVGQSISHYRITEKLGEGGMGVVYKAEDTTLDRPVALKFLAAHLLKDEEANKRFHREAKAAAALHHTNVCPIHEIAEADGQTFLAMAFIEGESLDKHIERGPLKIPEALDIAQQIARGLEAAHEKGVVHRDIKPGNVIVDDKGHVTVMDFGLALLTEGSKLTKFDTTLGTVAYMSPEQAEGAKVDHRTDIWALGCVLYEMVCGQRPFKGLYEQALVYEILNEEHEPITGVRAGVPMELEVFVAKCLAKDREERYKDAGDLAVDLKSLQKKLESGRSTIVRTSPAGSREQPAFATVADSEGRDPGGRATVPGVDSVQQRTRILTNRERLLVLVSAVLLIALLVVSFVHFGEETPEPAVRRFSFTPENLPPVTINLPRGRAAISPNGKHIVYPAAGDEPDEPTLWVRDIEHQEPRMLAGTEGAYPQGLFWSPDSRFIGFAANNNLKKVPVEGGSVITLCPVQRDAYASGSWSPDGRSIVFSKGLPPRVFEIPDQGGEPRLLFEPEITERGRGNWYPAFLPEDAGARAILFTVGTVNDQEIAVKNLENGRFSALVAGAFPVYSPSGHIVYQTNVREAGLWALPFSIETLSATGEAFRVAEGLVAPSLADDGTLVAVDFENTRPRQLAWFDRAGRKLDVMVRPRQAMLQPALSPDGRRVAVQFAQGADMDIWVHDVNRSVSTRLTFDPGNEVQPLWSPSGKEIAFSSNRRGNQDIFIRSADGSGEATLLIGAPVLEFPQSWSADGQILLYTIADPRTGWDIGYLQRNPQDGTFEAHVFLQTEFSETNGHLSPDGRFVAYDSDESGRNEIYARPFPQGSGKRQVTANGGRQPLWSKDGAELFYVEGETLMAVAVSTVGEFSVGSPKPLFRLPLLPGMVIEYQYDVSADGRRFVVIEDVEDKQASRPSVHIVQNWYEDFRDREQD